MLKQGMASVSDHPTMQFRPSAPAVIIEGAFVLPGVSCERCPNTAAYVCDGEQMCWKCHYLHQRSHTHRCNPPEEGL